jgi:prolyl-tRNA synthetase
MGSRDLENGTIEVARRDTLEKQSVAIDTVVDTVKILLEQIQSAIYQRALRFREENTHLIDTWDDFKVQIEKGGFIMAHWDGTSETEEKIKEETKATIRCIPFNSVEEAGKCVYSGKESGKRVVFARAY